jgi:hypothetical protein
MPLDRPAATTDRFINRSIGNGQYTGKRRGIESRSRHDTVEVEGRIHRPLTMRPTVRKRRAAIANQGE